jgi:hypothetical protein
VNLVFLSEEQSVLMYCCTTNLSLILLILLQIYYNWFVSVSVYVIVLIVALKPRLLETLKFGSIL